MATETTKKRPSGFPSVQKAGRLHILRSPRRTKLSGRRFFPAGVLVVVLCAGLYASAQSQEKAKRDPQWAPLFKGIEMASWQQPSDANADWPITIHAVRIDLKAPGIRFQASPSNGDRPGETDGLKTSAFLEKSGCQVAINASPFSPVGENEGPAKNIIGVAMSDGDLYSKAHGNYGALLISKKNEVRIGTPPFDMKDVHNAVGGFGMLLEGGKVVATGEKRHPRTAVGLSEDGRYLYAAVIDGRQFGHSVGATTVETAKILAHLGACTALNLDGGGSATLAVDDGKGHARVVNRPVHAHIPGLERVNGNHLGVFAEALNGD